MNLRYTLPDREQALCHAALQKEKIIYCVPYDLTLDGHYCADGYVVITKKHLLLLAEGQIKESIALGPGWEIRASSQIDNGLLVGRHDGQEYPLCRFSMRHMVRQSYVARGADAFCRGEQFEVSSKEREKSCPRCGRALRGTHFCPRCDGRGKGMRRFAELGKSYMGSFLLIVLCMLVISAAAIAQQFVQRDFIDRVLIPAKGTWATVLGYFVILLIFLLLSLLYVVRNIWSNSLGTRISRDMRSRVFAKINSLSLSFMDSRQAGELMNRVVEDSDKIRQFMQEVFSNMLTNLLTMIAAIVIMLIMDWKIALLTIAFMPLAALLIRLFHRKEMRMWRQQWRFNDKVNNRLQDVISGIRVVKSFGQEQREVERFNDYNDRLMKLQRRNELFWATLYPIVTYLMTIGSFFVILFGGMDVLNGRMTPGQLMQFVSYAAMLYGPLGYMTRLPRMLMQLSTSLERIYDILEEESDLDLREEAKPHDIVGGVEFRNVTFGYKSYEPILEHLQLTVTPGEMIGLVGSSGTGKSTLINLLMRLYDVDDGQICLDGIDLRDISPESLHRQIGVVLQETFLFSGTIFDNIRFAKPEATREEVIQAAKLANAHDFISRCPDGYDTYVGEHGYNLSGGERQRVAIARAILHNPRLLILDEATSALDTETEYQIQEALGRLTKGRTTFAIAHRLSTLRSADRIVVIDKHHIAEVGSHTELMRKKGIYYGLVMAQLEMHKVRE